jgi:glycerol-1-phosphate dehydrogenase [NAD(P)+]
MEIQIPELLRIKPRALNKVGKYLRKRGFSRIGIFYGEGMKDLVGEKVAISLDSSEIYVEAEETVTSAAIEDVVASTFRLPRGVQAIVAVGGGMAVDYGKYAGFLAQLPTIAVPTAISNDGFASPGASLYVAGKRVSCKARIPFGVVIDTDVVKGSPQRMTLSGVGDLLSKYSSIADWKLAYHRTGETVNDFAVMITLQSVENLVNHPDSTIDDDAFLQLVCGALVMSGVAMEVSGSSRPASGSEHLISHAYDQIASRRSLHGLQVAVATLATTWLQNNQWRPTVQRVLHETGVHDYLTDNRLDRGQFIAAIREAPAVKPGYYTVLSERGAVPRLVEYVSDDPYWDDYLE